MECGDWIHRIGTPLYGADPATNTVSTSLEGMKDRTGTRRGGSGKQSSPSIEKAAGRACALRQPNK
jgi:hypothetical protein